jgi:serine/threonine-protein kinase
MTGPAADDSRHADLLAWLDALLDLTDPERAARLAELARVDAALADELSAILAADVRLGPLLEAPLADWAQPLLDEVPADLAGGEASAPAAAISEGQVLGAWRLGPRLGAGGMGAVHAAERSDGGFAQRAAVKVLAVADGDGSLAARFEQERAILARLTHPGIARLLDGGLTAAGVPWFAMEMVEGSTLLDHCRDRAPGLKERLTLFGEIAAAVAHAHRHLVVHRDLKPANIMVTDEGRVKLLDFGIAKLLTGSGEEAGATLAGPRPFTPRYAAPEQVTGGAITTATDIYALGAILYELLSGRSPHGNALTPEHELMRAAVHDDPAPLTRTSAGGAGPSPFADADRLLVGDLRTIVGRCLRKDPAERYPSVDALLDDLRRAQAGEPVLARPPSRRYVLRKFVQRRRGAVTAGALAVVALLAGLGTTSWQARRATHEARRAEQVRSFLLELFASADPAASAGRDVTAREVLGRGGRRLLAGQPADPALRAELLATVGDLLRQVGAPAEADTILVEALAVAERVHGAESAEVGRVADALGGVVYELGRFEQAEPLHRRALAIHERLYGRRHRATAGSLANLAGVLSQTGDPAATEGLYREVLAIDTELLGAGDPAVATDLNNLAVCLYRAGRSAEAESLHTLALDLRRRLHGEVHPDVATSLHNRAAALEDLGRADQAEAHYRQALAIRRRLYPRGHVDTAGTLTGLGSLLRDLGRLDEARELLVEAAEINRRAYAGPHFELGRGYNALGTLAYSRGRWEEAADWFRQAHAVLAATIGPDNGGTLRTLNNLAVVLHRAGRLDESQRLFEQVIADRRRVEGDAAPDLALSAKGLGWVLLDRGRYARADSLLSGALATFAAHPNLGAIPAAEARLGVGACRLQQGRLAAAESLLVSAHAELAGVYDPDHDMLRRARGLLEQLRRKAGDAR